MVVRTIRCRTRATNKNLPSERGPEVFTIGLPGVVVRPNKPSETRVLRSGEASLLLDGQAFAFHLFLDELAFTLRALGAFKRLSSRAIGLGRSNHEIAVRQS